MVPNIYTKKGQIFSFSVYFRFRPEVDRLEMKKVAPAQIMRFD